VSNVEATVRDVTTAVHLSNVYHLLKVYQYDPAKWTNCLKTKAGGEADFNWDGFKEL
jgi:hypothetical protein